MVPKRCQTWKSYKTLDKRQISTQNSVNFSDERLIFVFFCLVFCLFGSYQAQFGFGEDTDAWLMAQTARKLALGWGYDPARSFGNPLYEHLLMFLQPGLRWEYSNVLNLFLGVIFVWRLPLLFSFLSVRQSLILQLSIMAIPVFNEAATSSMEYMLAWWLLLETLLAWKTKRLIAFFCFASLAIFTRLEFLPLLALALRTSLTDPHSDYKKLRIPIFILLAGWTLYLFWAWGQNPPPFTDFSGGLRFYGGRIWFLTGQAGINIILYIWLLTGIGQLKASEPVLYRLGTGNLVLFCFLPFEWAYSFPALLIGLAGLIRSLNPRLNWLVPAGILLGSFLSWNMKTKFSFQLPSVLIHRTEMTIQYELAQRRHSAKPTVLLFGATWFPTNPENWEKSMQNRLFHRTQSYFYVAEKLTSKEIDSLRNTGFDLLIVVPDDFNGKSKLQTIHKSKLTTWLREN
jgi:hypothetical protein